jgi:Na+-driven multidrug efflux pump
MFGFIATGTTIFVAQSSGTNLDKKAKEISLVSLSEKLLISVWQGLLI